MNLALFMKAIPVGMALAVPVGSAACLCMRSASNGRCILGLSSGLGACTADLVYGASMAAAAGAMNMQVLSHPFAGKLIGGLLLLLLGVTIMQMPPGLDEWSPRPERPLAAFLSTFIDKIASPVTFLTFFAMVTILGLVRSQASSAGGVSLAAGVFAGSSLWWLVLIAASRRPNFRMKPFHMAVFSRVWGMVLAAAGLFLAAAIAVALSH